MNNRDELLTDEDIKNRNYNNRLQFMLKTDKILKNMKALLFVTHGTDAELVQAEVDKRIEELEQAACPP